MSEAINTRTIAIPQRGFESLAVKPATNKESSTKPITSLALAILEANKANIDTFVKADKA